MPSPDMVDSDSGSQRIFLICNPLRQRQPPPRASLGIKGANGCETLGGLCQRSLSSLNLLPGGSNLGFAVFFGFLVLWDGAFESFSQLILSSDEIYLCLQQTGLTLHLASRLSQRFGLWIWRIGILRFLCSNPAF